nr:hypothetical protein [Vibrio cholerae]
MKKGLKISTNPINESEKMLRLLENRCATLITHRGQNIFLYFKIV